jgi:hypothetical protein
MSQIGNGIGTCMFEKSQYAAGTVQDKEKYCQPLSRYLFLILSHRLP